MLKHLALLACAGFFIVSQTHASEFADAVIAYDSGSGFASGFTNASTALGAPTINATPFSPAFQNTRLVSIGAGGSITLQVGTPISNNPLNPYGIDFIVFGNSGFIITNGNFSGGGITDGTLFGNNTGTTRVEVSADGVNWFALNSSLARTVDGLFPSDGSRNPHIPVDPVLTVTNFASQGLNGIGSLYDGSGGGTGFDLSWAQDTNGNNANLSSASYVRINVLSGKSEIDAVSVLKTGTLYEKFSSDPAAHGWLTFGNTNLFRWDSTHRNLSVTWDSSQPNSYFYHPLGTTLTRTNDFMLTFDLRLSDIAIGINTNKPFTFQIAVGLHSTADATSAGFIVGSGFQAPNLVEFNYFPDSGFGATVSTPMISSNNSFAGGGFTFPLELVTNALYQFAMTYTADNQTLHSTLLSNGVPVGPLQDAKIDSSFGDFRLDAVSISSYADAGQSPGFEGSVRAHGVLDNLVFASPLPVAHAGGGPAGNTWQVQFSSDTSWLYSLERTTNLQSWSAVAPTVSGNGANLVLQDTNPPPARAFYRVNAQRP